MSAFKRNFWLTEDDDFLSHVAAGYMQWQEDVLMGQQSSAHGHIPKVLHFIWLGSRLPHTCLRMIDSWRRHHPHFQINIWDDSAAAALSMQNRGLFDNAANFGEKSDLLRYEILYLHGGVYIDTDYECLGSLDGILESRVFFFAGMACCDAVEVNNGLIGCIPGHPFMQGLIAQCGANAARSAAGPSNGGSSSSSTATTSNSSSSSSSGGSDKPKVDLSAMHGIMAFLSPDDASAVQHIFSKSLAMQTIANTGPGMLTRLVAKYCEAGGEGGLVVFPSSVFGPVPNSVSVNLDNEEDCEGVKQAFATSETLSVHWWQKSWQK